MKVRVFVVFAVVMLGLVAACGGGNGDGPPATATSAPPGPTLPPIPTMEPRATATPVAGNPPGTRTDIEVIDDVLAAVEAADVEALVSVLSFHPFRCDNTGAEGSNPCPPGVAIGSAIDVVALGGCDAGFLARDSADLHTAIATFFAQDAGAEFDASVYAAVELAPGRLASPLPMRYLIIFSDGHTLVLDGTGVTHIGLPCESVGPASLFHPADRVILAPPQGS